MPAVTLTVGQTLSAAQKQQYGEFVQSALVTELNVPAHDKMIRIIELSPENFLISGSLQTVLLEISLFPGRTLDAKRAFYSRIVEQFTKVGVPAADVRIILNEVEPENWGLRGGLAGCDL